MRFSSWLRSVLTEWRSSRQHRAATRRTGRKMRAGTLIERLESRVLPSADVFGHVDNAGNLLLDDLTGASNNITVTRNKATNEFLVSSPTDELTTDKDGSTSTDHVRVSGDLVGSGIIAHLGDGDDRLDLSRLSLAVTVF